MSAGPPGFDFVHDQSPQSRLLVGFSEFGLAGLTAVNYVVDQLDLEQTGHVRTRGIQTVTPFEDGVPRHPTRLFGSPELDLTVLVGELFVPAPATAPFGRTMYDWVTSTAVSEVTVLSGVPVAHGPEAHRPFYIATPDYRDQRLEDTEIDPMGKGYLDGLNGSIMAQGMDRKVATGVLTTPAHAQTPDVEAALRLLDALQIVYDFDLDTGPLESFAAEIEQYYRELSARIEEAADAAVPEDRMYM